MTLLEDKDRVVLLKLARSEIASELSGNKGLVTKPREISSALMQKRGCFVTLHKRGALRGCIGTIEPRTALYACVAENAVNAAFRDPRFAPLGKNEIDEVDIEISVLTKPRALQFADGEDLKRQLVSGLHGVILSQGHRRSTFLPQVWEQLPDKEAFLEHLCLKGGMSRSCWQQSNTCVEVYEAEYFAEKQLLS